MSVYEVPLIAGAQSLSIAVQGNTYTLRVIYADAVDGSGGWVLDIGDASGAAILSGVPLITGADLLAQYAYLGIPGKWYVVTDGTPSAVPTYDNLGSQAHLYISVA